MLMNTIGPVIDHLEEGYESLLDLARDFLRGFDFSEKEPVEEDITYCEYIESYQGIGLRYDYGADYYFFTLE